MSLLRQLSFLAARHSFRFRVQHVAGRHNATADSLSRLQLSRFRALQSDARPTPLPLPESLRQFLAQPTEQYAIATGCVI